MTKTKLSQPRVADIQRNTKETRIRVSLDLDGEVFGQRRLDGALEIQPQNGRARDHFLLRQAGQREEKQQAEVREAGHRGGLVVILSGVGAAQAPRPRHFARTRGKIES